MKRNNKVVCGLFMAGMISMSATITGFAGSSTNTTSSTDSTTVTGRTGTAGIIVEMSKAGSEAMSDAGILSSSVETTSKVVVAEGEETETEAATEEKTSEAANETETTEQTEVVEGTEAVSEENTTAETERAIEAETESEKIQEAEKETELESTQEAETEKDTEDTQVAETEETAETEIENTTEENTEVEEKEEEAESKEDEAQSSIEEEWSSRVMANVEESMNIRSEANEEAALAGKFYRGDVATVVSNDGTWTQITSGNVTGYVKNEFCVYGIDAYNLANAVCTTYATSLTGGLNVRTAAGQEAEVITQAAEGDKLIVDTAAAPVDGWVAVTAEGQTAYVSAEFVSVEQNLGTALNIEEVAAREAAEAAEKAAKEAEEQKKKNAVSASSNEVTLLGALIQTEAGNGSYEGMVAVGAVVMNRVRSGAYPGSISGVIYQGGQFTPALNGQVDSLIRSGVKSSCLQAAQEALNGTDNTNGCLSFRSASSGRAGTVIGANVFF